MTSSTAHERAVKEALSYIDAILRVCYYDCSDSSEAAHVHLNRFNALVNDEITIKAFIEKHMLGVYALAWKTLANGIDYLSDEEKQTGPVCDLPVPYETFKHLLS